VLGPAALSRILADAYRRTGDRGSAANRPCWPWPMAVEPAWEAVHVDATWHATYWIAEWHRVDVDPDFLGPLLFSPLRRSISLVMEPVPPNRAARQVAQARTADLADHELRRRGGFLTSSSVFSTASRTSRSPARCRSAAGCREHPQPGTGTGGPGPCVHHPSSLCGLPAGE
jgi:hypothetical protein